MDYIFFSLKDKQKSVDFEVFDRYMGYRFFPLKVTQKTLACL